MNRNRRQQIHTAISEVLSTHKIKDGVCEAPRCDWAGPAYAHPAHVTDKIVDRLEGMAIR